MKYVFLIIITIVSILILWINIKLHSQNYTIPEKKADIALQLNFLESELKTNHLGQNMQQLFPEGFVFINALYGLNWCELAISDHSNDKKLKERAIAEALYAYNEINSDQAKQTFDHSLAPENGIYYFGWRNYLLSKILSIDTTFKGHEPLIDTFLVNCEIIKNALKDSESQYLQSYYGQSWPADMFVAMASLSNHDKVFRPKYKTEIKLWLEKVKERLDPETGLIPHQVDSETGKSIQGTRGCSICLILRMMAEIDPEFASKQYKLFEKNFVSTTFGLPSIREYPKGVDGLGDVDSGLVIFGVGFSATIVSIGTFSVLNKEYLAENQYKTIHAFGFARKTGKKKYYLFGKLPIADAFIAWGRASGLNKSESNLIETTYWRLKFHMISLLVVLVFWIIYFLKSIIRKIKTIFS